MIRIYLVRHGIAVDPAEKGTLDDDARPLTGKGRRRFRRLARAFARLGEKLDFIFTSPLVRAEIRTPVLTLGTTQGKDQARYDAAANHGPRITYEEIDVSLVKPVKRDYTGGAPKTGPAAPAPEVAVDPKKAIARPGVN